MKKISGLLCLMLVGIIPTVYYLNHEKTPDYNNELDPNPPYQAVKNKAEKLLETLTLDEKIGQMLFISYEDSDTLNTNLTNILTTVQPGGFILFSENLKNYSKSLSFIKDIKEHSKIPIFLGIDEEGGKVDRLKNITGYKYDLIPDMASIGATNNEEEAYQVGTQLANILNDFGLNIDFAPVSDVLTEDTNKVIGTRSFGSDPYLVARMTRALAKGLSDNSIIPVYKHFPGHGSTTTDSHIDLPIINKTKEELLKTDLIPFKNAIANNAQIIMIGHLALPLITGDYTPASLSKTIVTDILKNELGYENVIISDALNMKALTKYYTTEEIYELAINAGIDILLMPENPINTVKTIKKLITENKITEEQINNSVLKILQLKEKYNLI